MTRFEQFQQNVQRWATERGIYEHSTALAQALKAVSEVGELCDAVIKNETAKVIDGIGDAAVSVRLTCDFAGYIPEYAFDRVKPIWPVQHCAAGVSHVMGELAANIAGLDLTGNTQGALIEQLFFRLHGLALAAELDFDDCCEAAWNEIKDRKGRMVAGGAFVKEGE